MAKQLTSDLSSANLIGMKLFNHAAPHDFSNFTLLNESHSDSEMNHFMGVLMLKKNYLLSYSHFFNNLSLWEKVFLGQRASSDIVITQLNFSFNILDCIRIFN